MTNQDNQRKQAVSRLKPLCSNKKQWDAFCEYLDIMIAEQHRKLEQSSDTVAIHQSQGAVKALRSLKYLQDEALADG